MFNGRKLKRIYLEGWLVGRHDVRDDHYEVLNDNVGGDPRSKAESGKGFPANPFVIIRVPLNNKQVFNNKTRETVLKRASKSNRNPTRGSDKVPVPSNWPRRAEKPANPPATLIAHPPRGENMAGERENSPGKHRNSPEGSFLGRFVRDPNSLPLSRVCPPE
ncbi:hypothetical protein GWI33_019515 [Rhynchophorus ferrugineus]|uniref:Uncharacterized protein n=1 Tax=Rhynchophorus ferrugineus TaxID=354439 RepID=A0A834HTM7_RHYFE|nr:hypothetical protein GWI33_019515 [Rhynchophorus ferrugineus]